VGAFMTFNAGCCDVE